MESVTCSIKRWDPPVDEPRLVELLNRLITPFLRLWSHHCRTVQLSPVESIQDEKEWKRLVEFIQQYGRELFHARFLTLSNLRGILLRGVDAYLSHLQENPEALGMPEDDPRAMLSTPSIKLLDDLDKKVSRADAVRWLEIILHSLVAHYQEFLDYNSTSARSDYGENLYILLDLLRIKAAYERQAWQLQPLMVAHEVLARHNLTTLAQMWEQTLKELTRKPAEEYLKQLSEMERKHGTRLSSIRDRLEERFVKPLVVDRLRALIEPAMREARTAQLGEQSGAFDQFQRQLRPCTEVPTGSGLDLPAWLHRLHDEVQRVLSAQSRLGLLAEDAYRVPRRFLTLEELEHELSRWTTPR